jgi:membrane dipeptidase
LHQLSARLLLLLLPLLWAPAAAQADDYEAKARKILTRVPLIDGHNDLPWAIRTNLQNRLEALDLLAPTDKLPKPLHTDLQRLRRGGVGGQFWSVYVPVELGRDEAVRVTFEQIDLVHRLVARYPSHFALATTADEVVRAHKAGKVASLIGMEGGHSLGNSLAVLRQLYAAGARYLTLTHWKSTDWADAATSAPVHDGLSPFGVRVVKEMNRLGMLVDLSHVSAATMHDALDASEAPVIFSHSGAMAICDHPRNVPDDVLARLKQNGGVVMAVFLPAFVNCAVRDHWAATKAETARLEVVHPGDPARQAVELAAWNAAHPKPRATLAQVADHVDQLRKVAGVDHIGLGSDFDGMQDVPEGLSDVAGYPALLGELLRRGYTEDQVAKIAGLNLLRVMRQAEAVATRLRASRPPDETWFEAAVPQKQ